MTPEELMAFLQQTIDEGIVNQVYHAASVKEVAILETLRKDGVDVYALDDIAKVPTEQLDAIAQKILKSAQRSAALTGLTYGAFPLVALVPELVHLLIMVIRTAQRLSLTYGQEIESYRGSLKLWETLGAAFGVDPDRLEGTESELFKNLPIPLKAGAMPLTPVMFRLIQGILLAMAYAFIKSTFRIVPLVGIGIATAANFRLMQKVGRHMKGEFRSRHQILNLGESGAVESLDYTFTAQS